MKHEPKQRKAYTSVRLAPELHDQIVAAARKAGRSVTQEVELRLEVAGLTMRGARIGAARRGYFIMATTTKSWRDVLKIHPAADMFPLLGPEELKALGEDIRANGLMMPIDLFATELGGPYLVLDDRNRLDAMESIGWRFEYDGRHIAAIDQTGEEMRGAWGIPNSKSLTAEAYGWDPIPFDPYDYVISVNIRRRHLTTAQKGELIAALLRANPERSDRAIAKDVKVDHKTVSARREKLEQGGENPHHDVRTGSDGVAQPATKPLQKPADTEPPEPQRPAVEEPAGTEQDQAGEPAVVPPSLGPEMDPASLDHELKDWVATFNSWSRDRQQMGLTLLDVEEDRELLDLVELRREMIAQLKRENQLLREQLAATQPEPTSEPEEAPRPTSEPKAAEPPAEQIEQPVAPVAPTPVAPVTPTPPQPMKDREETIAAFEKAGADGLSAWQRQLMRIDAAVVEALTAEGVLSTEHDGRVRRIQPWLRSAA